MTDTINNVFDLYNDLVAGVGSGGWNQTLHPAEIRIKEPKQTNTNFEGAILMEIDDGTFNSSALGATSNSPILIDQILHILLTVKNPQYSQAQLLEYYYLVIGVFVVWFKAKDYDNCELVALIPEPSKTRPLKADIWLKYYAVA